MLEEARRSQHGAPYGQGTYTWFNGDQYVGDYINGQKHGKGTLTYPDGKIEKGLWQYDKFVK